MTVNIGHTDRVIRLILGVLLIGLPLMNLPPIWASPLAAYASMALGAVLAITSTVKFCPLYRIFGLSTCNS